MYKKLKKTDKGINREWLFEVNGGWRSGREGSLGQVLCRTVAQLWGGLQVCGVGGGS